MKLSYSILIMLSYMFSNISAQDLMLSGLVFEKDMQQEHFFEPICFATVVLKQEGKYLESTLTDVNGNYEFKQLDPGTYEITINYLGYKTRDITFVIKDETLEIDIDMEVDIFQLEQITILDYKSLVAGCVYTYGNVTTIECFANIKKIDETSNRSDENHGKIDLVIYPNPTIDRVHIQAEALIDAIQIFDLQSRLVYYQENIQLKTHEINVQDLLSGNYIVMVKTPRGISTKKLSVIDL